MKDLREYDIFLSGLKPGKHEYQFHAGADFFDYFGVEQEFTHPDITAEIVLDKYSTFFELYLDVKGSIHLVCDISGEDFPYEVAHQMKLIVKLGHEHSYDSDEIITIPENDSVFNVAQLIYESTVLSVPMKKVKPELDEEILSVLERYAPKLSEEKIEEEQEEDPRWAALKKLRDNNK